MDKFICFAWILLGIVSCGKYARTPDGLGGDMHFDKENLTFSRDSSSTTIQSDESFWWLLDVVVGEDTLPIFYNFTDNVTDEEVLFERHYLDSLGASITPELLYRTEENIDIRFKWLRIMRNDKYHLHISVLRNDTEMERKATIHFESGNYFSNIKITQQ